MKQKRCNNQSQIFREITASKFEGQHVPQFSFYRYEGLCHGTKTEIHHGFLRFPRNFAKF